ncbi:RDD family protein [Proteobacteria bacterium 005FR1]|nr:RDD family protein [Proteobacteria bacterium 005FR1]
MSEQNIYQTPQSAVMNDIASAGQLASRWARLGAALIDGFLVAIIALPIIMALGLFETAMAAAQTGEGMSMQYTIISGVLSMAAFLFLNGYLLAKSGQTVGKKLVSIRIADMDGDKVPFSKLVGLRYIPYWGFSYIPIVGGLLGLINVLFIFRSDKRCIHDLIAGTQVINCR